MAFSWIKFSEEVIWPLTPIIFETVYIIDIHYGGGCKFHVGIGLKTKSSDSYCLQVTMDLGSCCTEWTQTSKFRLA